MFNFISANFTRNLRFTKFPGFRRYVSDTKSGTSIDKASLNEPTTLNRVSDIHKSKNWDQNVSFSLKECILYDTDRRGNNYLDYRISQMENKLHSTALQTENKLLLIIVGSTALVISSIIASNYVNNVKTVIGYNNKQETVDMLLGTRNL